MAPWLLLLSFRSTDAGILLPVRLNLSFRNPDDTNYPPSIRPASQLSKPSRNL